ncbi:QcrA and Rieske domain-containing protein [Kocuria tytonis]|uniref:Cytochrome bc1 complex Rieske iron-sulfur subunit n=1 Tax=Kocuria tytonis TaxID=2054280 RepID=A0A495A8C6_9MICC|nr:Rieske (2Fe-2S) protein [Kocuria tytonis]RKQ36291.1 Rieske (2Fe-2S) protein [Kocuria tytonis]
MTHPAASTTQDAHGTRSRDAAHESAAHAPATGPSRRRAVGVAGLTAAGALALSACGSGRDSDAAASPSAPSTPTDVAAAADVPVGSGITVDKGGVKAVVGQPEKGTFTAYSPVCPHQGCMVNPADKQFVCPCHNSVFDMASGDVTGGPATTGLSPYPVKVENGRVIVG